MSNNTKHYRNIKSGKIYKVISMNVINTTNKDDGTVMVLYKGPRKYDFGKRVFVREYVEFCSKFEPFEKASKEYDDFITKYKEDHILCPACGGRKHFSTHAIYGFDSAKKQEYKDLNTCECCHCGNIHTTHDRVSVEEFRLYL